MRRRKERWVRMEKMILDFYRSEDEMLNDAFDRLVVNIHIQKEMRNQKAFVITGCKPQVGTTTIAMNLAISMALSGWKTVLVDTDLRKQRERKRFSNKVGIGLSEYLCGDWSKEEVLCDTNYELLKYVSCGNAEENPVRLLCSNRMNLLLEELEKEFDYVILDLPAIYTSADTNILISKSNAVILVAAQQSTTIPQIEEAKRMIDRIGGTLLGIILNKVEMREYHRYMKFSDCFKSKRYFNKRIWSVFCMILFLTISMNMEIVRATDMPIYVESYQVTEGTLVPGAKMKLELTLKNGSSIIATDDLLLSFYSADELIYPVFGRANQIFLGTMKENETKIVEIPIVISEKAGTEKAKLSFQVNCSGRNGNGIYTNTFFISLPIEQVSLLEVKNISIASNLVEGTKSLVSIGLTNSGKKSLSHVMFHAEGEIDESQKTLEIGTLSAKDSRYLDTYVSFLNSGSQQISFWFTYQDENGTEYTTDAGTYVVDVAKKTDDSSDITQETLEENQKTEKNSTIVFGILILFALLAVGVVLFAIQKR